MRVVSGIEGLKAVSGQPLGTSDWVTVQQAEVDKFAEATGDFQWIHVDRERAESGPYGTTIVHGYMTLALLPRFMKQIYSLEGFSRAVNYGLNKVRFIAPVPVGSRLRAATRVLEVKELDSAVQATFESTIEIEGSEKPACVAEQIGRYYVAR